mmetsp:Transcript_30235/g.66117  ORF Transcript_30235/g.66117 Transcript_30235/m.66117 type:complete len:266 (+) Transcript_30235:612-1409(+)
MARTLSSSLSLWLASTIIFVDSTLILSFSFSDSFSSAKRFSLSFFCSSNAFASASSLLIFGFGGGTFAGSGKGKSMSLSSACSASQFTAWSNPALSVLYRAFSARSSGKPISMICCSISLFTASLTASGFGSPSFLSSGSAASMTTSPLAASAMTTSGDDKTESRNSSDSLSKSWSPACSASHFSAASRVLLVKCRALAARALPWPFTSVSAINFFWSTESRNLFFLSEAWLFFFCNSSRYATVFCSKVLESGSRIFRRCTSASV